MKMKARTRQAMKLATLLSTNQPSFVKNLVAVSRAVELTLTDYIAMCCYARIYGNVASDHIIMHMLAGYIEQFTAPDVKSEYPIKLIAFSDCIRFYHADSTNFVEFRFLDVEIRYTTRRTKIADGCLLHTKTIGELIEYLDANPLIDRQNIRIHIVSPNKAFRYTKS